MKVFICFVFCFSVLKAFANPMQNVEEMYVKVDGAELFCKTLGEGSPIIVVHGGPGLMHDYLYPELAKLSETHLLVFYDQRGTGRSTGEINAETIRIDRFVDDLEAVRQAFGFDKVTLLGHSFGALISVKYAMYYQKFVDKLIMINTAPLSMEGFIHYGVKVMLAKVPYNREFKMILESPEFLNGDPSALAEYVKLSTRISCYDKINGVEMPIPLNLKAFRDYEKVYSIFSDEVFSNDFNWFSKLREFQFPTLIMHGAVDSIPFEIARKAHQNIQDSYLIKFEKSGHYIPNEQPEEMLMQIRSFLFNRYDLNEIR